MARGICYLICGGGRKAKWRRYLGAVTVSIYSLRQYYDGEIAILIGEDIKDAELPARFEGVQTRYVPLAQVERHIGFVTKATLWRHSPFDNTVLMDADTVCTGPIDELFGHPFTAVHFAEWVTTGPRIRKRLEQWRAIPEAESMLRKCLSHPYPHVNTGVLAWQRDAAILPEWERLTIAGQQCSWTDEYAAQLLISDRQDVRILDDRYNCSPTYGISRDDARIWHFHGRRYVRQSRDAYRPHLVAAIEANAGGIADWLRDVDPALWELAQ